MYRALLLVCMFTGLSIYGSSQTFQGIPQTQYTHADLNKEFSHYEIYDFDISAFDAFCNRRTPIKFTLDLGDRQWRLELWHHQLHAPDFKVMVATESGVQAIDVDQGHILRGVNLTTGGAVRLTVQNDFILGTISDGETTYFVESLQKFVAHAPKDRIVMYDTRDVKEIPGAKCGYLDLQENVERLENMNSDISDGATRSSAACYSVEIALAADWSMSVAHGGTGGVTSHLNSIMNLVANDWDDEFANGIEYLVTTIWVSSCASCDPWTSSTNGSTLLSSFSSWGPGGLGVAHDVGQLWTRRNLGSIVGIAWLSSVCSNNGYNVCEDFTGNLSFLRELSSHELGHNWSAFHDSPSSPTIMTSGAFGNNAWSPASISSINNYTNTLVTLGCLGPCFNAGPPPVAQFTSAGSPFVCSGETVQFIDQSQNNPDEWNWYFEGGIPTVSYDQNPIVFYPQSGFFLVELEACNSGGCHLTTEFNFVQVLDIPVAAFNHVINGLDVTFINSSQNGNINHWDFGDSQISTQVSPQHTYFEDGEYQVTLSVTNQCTTVVTVQTIIIQTAPTASFTAEANSGCAPFSVTFTDESTANATSWEWEFEGGDPATSTEQHPTVVYDDPGIFDVSLTAGNTFANNTVLMEDYIVVLDVPDPNFSYNTTGLLANFTNSSSGGTTFAWDFGDGTTSVEENPEHEYSDYGSYTVILEVTNECGTTIIEQTVTVTTPPIAGFSASSRAGCAPFEVDFKDESSTNATSWMWMFEGGTPAMSNEQNPPTVTYFDPGTYEVSLEVSNGAGSSQTALASYITVIEGAESLFEHDVAWTTALFENQSVNSGAFHWDFGDGETSTEPNPVHIYNAFGTYEVMLIALNNGCADTTWQTVVVDGEPNTTPGQGWPCDDFFTHEGCGGNDFVGNVWNSPEGVIPFNMDILKAYPNPSNGDFQLVFLLENPEELVTLQVMDLTGQVVMSESWKENDQLVRKSILGLSSGTYTVYIRSANQVLTERVVVHAY